ncbi:MAG: 16S rRNA (guanine(527)-N(7))-methyltransferase RsmG [Acidithiobacillales bacterium]
MSGEGELERRIRELGVSLPAGNAAVVLREAPRLARFLTLLLAANRRMNLVSAGAARPEELIARHLFDALFGLGFLPAPRPGGLALLDIGSGGGLPALPLLLVRGDLRATLVESTAKKSRFLAEACRELALTADVVNARFPGPIPMASPARFDLLTSRAVSGAGRLVRAAGPLLASGARALLWTTAGLYDELVRESGCAEASFHRTPGAEKRGIAVLESFT